MEKEISNALGHGPQDEILSSAFKLRITRGDRGVEVELFPAELHCTQLELATKKRTENSLH